MTRVGEKRAHVFPHGYRTAGQQGGKHGLEPEKTLRLTEAAADVERRDQIWGRCSFSDTAKRRNVDRLLVGACLGYLAAAI